MAKQQKNRSIYSSLIGSVTGALILTRSQSLILIPFIALIFYITALKSWKRIVIYICLFALGIALVVTPWLYRNYQISGHFALEDSRNTSDMVNRIMGKPVETYQGIYILDNPEQVLFKQVFASYLNHPLETLKFIGNHFFNNMISSIRILPIRTELIKNFDSIFRLDDLFWTKQGNEFKFIQAFILVVYLLIIAIGISYAFITTGVSGLTPIIIFLGYSLSSAITRISGWRFIISVDWVVLLYFWIGLYSCLLFILNLLGVNINNLSSTKLFNKIKFSTSIFHLKNIRKTIFVNILFLCFGLALPLFVYIMPRPYASQSRAENIEEIKNAIENYDISAFTKGKIFKALEDDSVFIETGKAFYPRFYKSGDGEPINQKNIYYFQDYPRLLFYFIGRIRKDVQLEISESPKVFPNNTDVIICATDKDEFWETLFVLVKSDPKIIFFSDSINTYTIHKIFSRSLLLNSN